MLMPHKDGIDMIVARSQIRNEIPIIAVFGGQCVLSSDFNLSLVSLVAFRSTLAQPFTGAGLRLGIKKERYSEVRVAGTRKLSDRTVSI
jgi:hypothetical protein